MCLPGMAAVLKPLLTICLTLVLLLGGPAQLMPPNLGGADTSVSAGMAGGCADPKPPCHMPSCLDHGGCIGLSALPASPAAIAVPVEWTSPGYAFAPQPLSGISVKPELAPPILVA